MDLNLLLATPPWDWPKGIGKTFGKLLRDRRANPAERLIAADLAGDFTVINDDLINALLAVLRDSGEPEELRARAAISFGAAFESAYTEFDEEINGFGDDEMVPISDGAFLKSRDALQKLYSDTSVPKQVRRRILEASVRAPMPWHTDAIRQAYASGDREWMLTAVFAMRFVPDFEKETLEALKSGDSEILGEAIRAAGDKELDAAWDQIYQLAQDDSTEKDLRIAAIGAIGDIRPEEARELLWKLTDSEDEDIAEAADDAISMLGDLEDVLSREEEEAEEEDDEDDEEEKPF